MTEDLKQGSKLGNYELILRVGRGGMATVWVARERAATTKDDRLVAVKVMLTELADENEFIKMFLDEVRLVRSIRHPNVVDVYVGYLRRKLKMGDGPAPIVTVRSVGYRFGQSRWSPADQ